MAEHGAVELGTAGGVNFADHEKTYRGFLRLFKYSTVGVALVVIFVLWLIG